MGCWSATIARALNSKRDQASEQESYRLPNPSSRSSPHRLTAQVLDLKQQLAEANATKTCTSPTSTQLPQQPPTAPPATDIDAAAVLQTPGTTDQQSPAGFPHDQVAAGGKGYIYVVDPSLQGEIERLKENVAERDRIIKRMEKLDRTKRKKGVRTEASHEHAHDVGLLWGQENAFTYRAHVYGWRHWS